MTEVYFYLQIIIINKNYNLCSFLILKNIYSGNEKNSLLRGGVLYFYYNVKNREKLHY